MFSASIRARVNRPYIVLLLIAFALGLQPALAEKQDYSHLGENFREFDDLEEKEWEENEVKLPDGINEDSMVEFEVPGANRYRYFLDRAQLSLGTDEVLRYVVEIRSSSGTRLITYEGIRCDEREYKVYGRLQRNGKFRASRRADWKRLNRSPAEIHRAHLFEEVVCNELTGISSLADIRRYLDGREMTLRHLDTDEIRD